MGGRRMLPSSFWLAFLLLSLSSSSSSCLWSVHARTLRRLPRNRVGMTVVKNAAATGAVCLDGSSPAYHLQRGSGNGAANWILQFEGGGWCNDVESCLNRSTTRRGSTTYMPKFKNFRGILSNAASHNPDFHNWNRVKLRYCDGASFGGDAEYHSGTTKLYFRGQRIWNAIIKDLLPKGLGKAKKVLLSGCSAGGLATFLHCDDLARALPPTATVKCLSDAGFFLDVADIVGNNSIRPFFKGVVDLQNVSKILNSDCVKSQRSPYKCFFPQYALPNIKQPYFILNSAYDIYQFNHIFVPASADPHKRWHPCKHTLKNCTTQEMSLLQGFRKKMIDALQAFRASKIGGLYINSCYAHCQSEIQEVWYAPNSPKIHGKRIAEVVGDWYFERKVAKEIDYPYPRDSTCHVPIQNT